MQFIDKDECVSWCSNKGISLKNKIPDTGTWKNRVDFAFPEKAERYYWFTQFVESFLEDWDHCLFWVTTWGVWPNSENMHLYYKLRQTYQDNFYIDQKPGHITLKHEKQDIISFLYLFILFGWDAFLLSNDINKKIMISHDEYVILSTDGNKEDIKKQITEFGGLKLL